jgi:hypothetical protein
MRRGIAAGLTVCVSLWMAALSPAQNVAIQTPTSGLSTGYYEQIGVTGLSGLGPVIPPFGGYNPAADARLGIRLGSFELGITAGQGSRRTFQSQTPMLTLPHGGTGTLFHGQVRPFVTGIVPVVGMGGGPIPPWVYDSTGIPAGPSDLSQRIARWQAAGSPMGAPDDSREEPRSSSGEIPTGGGGTSTIESAVAPSSSASTGDTSVSSIERAHAAADAAAETKVDELVREAEAVASSRQALAIHKYRQAMKLSHGERRAELAQRVRELESRKSAPLDESQRR